MWQNNLLRAILVTSLVLLAYSFASYNDYQELVDKVTPIKYTNDYNNESEQHETQSNQKQTYY